MTLREQIEGWAEGAGIASGVKGYDAVTRALFDGECMAYDRVLAALDAEPKVLAEVELREWLEREEYGTRVTTRSEKVKNVMKGQAIAYRRVINWLERGKGDERC